ncbi:hypothetical protein EC991_004757 [Linnemannia zychae]|nr:hypothetical protein EC991_004757 [Linnemannia zychae]
MLSHSHATTTPVEIASYFGTNSKLESRMDQSTTTTTKKKKKKKKKSQTTATPGRTEDHPPADNLMTAKAAVEAAEAAAAAAEAVITAAVEAAGAAEVAAAAAKEAAERAAKAARAANTAAKAATEAIVAIEAARAVKATAKEAKAVEAAEVSETEKVAAGEYEDYEEYEESEEERAKKTYLYVPVEGDIQVRQRSFATTEEILEWPYTEGHVLTNRNLANEPYLLTGFIRSFDFGGPINKRYSRIYGNGTAQIRGPAAIFNENSRHTVSLTKKDIPRIFR